MKVLVTGGAGFIGSHVVDQLIEEGHEVVVIDDLSTGRLSNLNPKARFYQLDIRSPELRTVFEIERPVMVNHHAAQMDVRRSVVDPLLDANTNILGSIHLLQLSQQFGVRKFIYISSGGAVYGEPVYLPCDEAHPVRPLCPYGASKYSVEMYLSMYRENFGLDYSIIRYPNVYGPRQDPKGEAGVVSIFIGQMMRNLPIWINGTGEQMRDFVYVEDCARANLLVMNSGSGQVFNLGYGVGTTINQVFSALVELTGYPHEPQHGPAKTGETFRIYLDADRATRELGWKPSYTLQEGLRRTVEYFKQTELAVMMTESSSTVL